MKATGKEGREERGAGGGARKKADKTEKAEAKGTRKIRFCMYYLQGVCKYTDETCDFAHSTEEIGPEGRARRSGKKVGQAAPSPAHPDAYKGKNMPPPPPPPPRAPRPAEGSGRSPGQRRGGGAPQPAAGGPSRAGAPGPGPDPVWLVSPEQVRYPGPGDQVPMEMPGREYSSHWRAADAGPHSFAPPPGIPYADARADQSVGGLQRSIADLSQAIKRFAAHPPALQDSFGGAGQNGQQPAEGGLSEAHMAAMCALRGPPRGGRNGAPHARYEDAGAMDKFAPRKVAVSPQSWPSGGFGCGGPPAAEDALHGRPYWAPPGLGS